MVEASSSVEGFVVLRSHLFIEEQRRLVESTFQVHYENSIDVKNEAALIKKFDLCKGASISLNLGLKHCGAPLIQQTPYAAQLARNAFAVAAEHFASKKNESVQDCSAIPHINALRRLAQESTSLTGIALLYGPCASMLPHYDSPTQPKQKHEWLVMFSCGHDVVYQLNNHKLTISSGDVVVMDAMNVLHAVLKVQPPSNELNTQSDVNDLIGLPVQNSRLGILLWQAAESHPDNSSVRRKDRFTMEQDDDEIIGTLFD